MWVSECIIVVVHSKHASHETHHTSETQFVINFRFLIKATLLLHRSLWVIMVAISV